MNFWRMFVPGMLVAATGVGAGDLATAALIGAETGVTLLWAAVVGCAFKWLLSEGIARYQLGCGDSVVRAMFRTLPTWLRAGLAVYFVVWTFLVGAALMSASGVVLHALVPLGEATRDKMLYGAAASLLGWWLVRRGGNAWFERAMALCTGAMAIAVLGSAIALAPAPGEVAAGLVPTLPAEPQRRADVIALMGGIGGTVTLLCYGSWIAAKGRRAPGDLRVCRIDLAAAYTMTALFGVGMLVVGSSLQFRGEGGGATLAVAISDRLSQALGPVAGWTFRIGAFAAVFSSLLGVWHSVPLLCADALAAWRDTAPTALETTPAYRRCQAALALLPMVGLVAGFARMQRAYAIAGSLFTPLLAVILAVLLRRPELGPLRANRAHQGLLLAIGALYALELRGTLAG